MSVPRIFREGILRFNPNGTAPIFALSSKAGKRTVNDPEFFWWCEGNVITRLQVNGAAASTDTIINVDLADPTSTTLSANLGTATNLKPGDVLLVEPVADLATFNHELIQVDDVLSDTQFTAKRGVGGTSAATIADNVFLTVIGLSYAEGTGVPRAVSRNPIKFHESCPDLQGHLRTYGNRRQDQDPDEQQLLRRQEEEDVQALFGH